MAKVNNEFRKRIFGERIFGDGKEFAGNLEKILAIGHKDLKE